MAPWGDRPRHRTWASDTVLTSIAAAVVIVVYMVWEAVGTAPQGMVTLVGLAGGALFGAAAGDKRKKDADVERTAHRAEAKADTANAKADRTAQVAEAEHPDTARRAGLPPDDLDGR